MPLTKRIIPCLDVKDNRVVKGVKFIHLRDAGDPVELARYYNEQGADELVFLDITASHERRKTIVDVVKKISEQIFIPFTVGGGIKTINDINQILRAGADKISINTAAIQDPDLIREAKKIFGSQCIVVAIDAKRNFVEKTRQVSGKNFIKIEGKLCWWEVYTHGGRIPTGLDALEWAKTAQDLGCGEILPTSMDMDGKKEGYDLYLTKLLADNLDIPIIASGGCGNPYHIVDVFKEGKADAALAASIFHFNKYSIKEVKEICFNNNIPIRFE
jgi:cyclase